MLIEDWSIERPIPYAKNARKWSASAVEKIAASLREFGFRQPIVVDGAGVIVIGHLRLAGAKSLGLKTVPVHVASDLKPAQIAALRLADNRLHEEAQWIDDLLGVELMDLSKLGFDLGATAFDRGDIAKLLGTGTAKSKVNTLSDGLEFKVIVDCNGEAHQAELLARFKGEELKCRALIS